jgi:hypothetical protein
MRKAGPYQFRSRQPVPGDPCPKRNRQGVTWFTGELAAAALNLRYGRKNPSISVRPKCGHPGRLRLDCRRQRSGHFCADLPHPDLTNAAAGAGNFACPREWVCPQVKRFSRKENFAERARSPAMALAKSRQAGDQQAPRNSQYLLCESGIMHLAASALPGTGALSLPLLCQS